MQGQWWPHPLHVTQQGHFASVVVQTSSSSIPSCGTPHSHPLTVSLQPTAILSPRLFSKLHGLASSPFAHLQAPYPGWGVQGCGTDLFLGSPLRAPKLLFCWLISLPVSSEWASLDAEPLLCVSFSPGVQVPSHFLFAFSFFHPTQLHRDLSCPFRCLRASAGVQLVLCEIYPCVDCVFDAFVGRGELMSYCSSTLWTVEPTQLTHYLPAELTHYLLETSAHQLSTPVLLTR